jgi:hypothetical protein
MRKYLNSSHSLPRSVFKQRYYENKDYWSAPNGPIFLALCGEGKDSLFVNLL